MSARVYKLLGSDLDITADRAREHFAKHGARSFACEEEIDPDLPLKPTWQASTQNHYKLCIDVRSTLSVQSYSDFVTKCATGGHPINLWVILPHGDVPTRELTAAKGLGLGVGTIDEHGRFADLRQPLPLSLFGLRPLPELARIPKARRAVVKKAHDDFLNGSPAQACQTLHQELEDVTRRFAAHSYKKGWWRAKKKATTKKVQGQGQKAPWVPGPKFFTSDSWAAMLDRLDQEVIEEKVRKKCSTFKRLDVAAVRGHTGFRNDVSHAPKNARELRLRDQKLRTEFESVMDLLVTWFEIERRLKF